MLSDSTIREFDRIFADLFPNTTRDCNEGIRQGRIMITTATICRLDSMRIAGMKFIIDGVTFQPVKDLFGFGHWSDYKLIKGDKVYDRVDYGFIHWLSGRWIDPDNSDF